MEQHELTPESLEPLEIRFQYAPDDSVCLDCGSFVRGAKDLAQYLAFQKIVYYDEVQKKMVGYIGYCKCGETTHITPAVTKKPDREKWWMDK